MPPVSLPSSDSAKRPRKLWWLLAMLIFMFCVLSQMPASWLVQRFMPNSPYLQYVSGNLWRGNAIWQLPQAQALAGEMTWQWRPWQLLLGRFGADLEIRSGTSRVVGQGAISQQSWQVSHLSGNISPQTLSAITRWQTPDTPIVLSEVAITRHQEQGFRHADGTLSWAGGEFGYPMAGRVLQMTLPEMRVSLSPTSRADSNVLHAQMLDAQNRRLGDFYLEPSGMLDVSLTQRLLESMSEYQGRAPQDTAVVSLRQPLASLGAP